jgi:hypothetical protein
MKRCILQEPESELVQFRFWFVLVQNGTVLAVPVWQHCPLPPAPQTPQQSVALRLKVGELCITDMSLMALFRSFGSKLMQEIQNVQQLVACHTKHDVSIRIISLFWESTDAGNSKCTTVSSLPYQT